jgi:hypothetical protein
MGILSCMRVIAPVLSFPLASQPCHSLIVGATAGTSLLRDRIGEAMDATQAIAPAVTRRPAGLPARIHQPLSTGGFRTVGFRRNQNLHRMGLGLEDPGT